MILASCSDVRFHNFPLFVLYLDLIYYLSLQLDFGLWTPEQKQVIKEKVSSRITAAAWSCDGTMLAIGMISGMITVRSQAMEELIRFERRYPIWCLVFIPDTSPPTGKTAITSKGAGTNPLAHPSAENKDLLVVGCWDKTYSLYK